MIRPERISPTLRVKTRAVALHRRPCVASGKPRVSTQWRRHGLLAFFVATLLLRCSESRAQGTWPTLAGDASRSACTPQAFPSLASPAWTCSKDENGRVITFVARAPVAVGLNHVFTTGAVAEPAGTTWKLFAIARRTGAVSWSVPIDSPQLESIAPPVIDDRTKSVYVAGGSTLFCIAVDAPTVRWSLELSNPIVNACSVVARHWRGPGVLFLTDYDGFGDSASLYAIGIDPISASNPHAPGEIRWSVPIGAASGNSPTFDAQRDRVYVSAVGLYATEPGKILAFPAHAPAAPAPVWAFTNPAGYGFFGGIALDQNSDAIYAASYGFYGGTSSGNLVKLKASTGALLWSTSCNRSGSIPVRLTGDRLALATGLQGFGTVPSLQVFSAATGASVWSSHTRTWTDANHNNQIDAGEFTPAALWNTQPVLSTSTGQLASTGGDSTLRLIDLQSVTSSTSPFVVAQSATGITGSPVVAGSNLYAIGNSGLLAFGAAPAQVDVNGDAIFDIEDLYAWEQGRGQRDVNGDGQTTSADRDLLSSLLRANEMQEQTEGRR